MGNTLRTLEAILWLGALAVGIGFVSLYAEGKLPSILKAGKSANQSATKERIEDLLGPSIPSHAPGTEQKMAKALPAKAETAPVAGTAPKSELPATVSGAVQKPVVSAVVRQAGAPAKRAPAPKFFVPVKSGWPFELSADEKIGNPAAETSRFADNGTALYFAFGSSALTDSAADALNKVSAEAAAKPEAKIVVRAFTDGIGKVCSNGALSELRAQSVSKYLISHGVSAKRISLFALGPQNSFASNESARGRTLNRRAEVLIDG